MSSAGVVTGALRVNMLVVTFLPCSFCFYKQNINLRNDADSVVFTQNPASKSEPASYSRTWDYQTKEVDLWSPKARTAM